MTAKEIIAELKRLGTEQTKKMWMKHGAQEPCLGVKVEDMKKIQKRVKMDYQLALDLSDIKSLLQRVANSIHQHPNRVKYVMNGFVIAVACHVKPLHKLAVETAHRIGKVEVDLVGDCKIPFAPDHIKKFEARSPIGKKRKSPKC